MSRACKSFKFFNLVTSLKLIARHVGVGPWLCLEMGGAQVRWQHSSVFYFGSGLNNTSYCKALIELHIAISSSLSLTKLKTFVCHREWSEIQNNTD